MNEFPRLALATPAEDAEPSVACLAMLAGLTERALASAALSHACVPDGDGGRGPGDGFAGAASGCVAHAAGGLSRVVCASGAFSRALDRGRDAWRAEF